MLKKPLWLFVGMVALLLALYSGYWFWLAATLQGQAQQWLQARTAEGFSFSSAAPARLSGFPGVITLTFDAPQLVRADAPKLAATSLILRVAPLAPRQIHLRTVAPIIRLPWGARAERLALAAAQAQGQVAFFADGFNFSLDNISFAIVPVQQEAVPSFSFRAASLALAAAKPQATQKINQPANTEEIAEPSLLFTLSLADVRLQSMAQSPMGALVPLLTLNGKVNGPVFNPAVAASARAWRDAGGTIDMDALKLIWGDVTLLGNGTMALDSDDQLSGAFSAVLRGHDQLVETLVQSGKLPPLEAMAARATLGVLAKPSAIDGEPEIQTPITVQNGALSLGPLRLFALPRLIWE